MKYTQLGRTGLKVSRLVLGTMNFGPQTDEADSHAIMDAADYYFEKTGRQLMFEYVVLRGHNDSPKHARELADLLRGRCAVVNLIPFNDVEGLPYRRPTDEALAAFTEVLRQAGIPVKVRKRKGSAIDAACGQLRRRVDAPAAGGAGGGASPRTR